jgi:hypothetical protein
LEHVRRWLERVGVAGFELVGIKAIYLNSSPPVNKLVVQDDGVPFHIPS